MQTRLNDISAAADQDDYLSLPDPIRMAYTRQEYLWLTDDQKRNLTQRETEPEIYE